MKYVTRVAIIGTVVSLAYIDDEEPGIEGFAISVDYRNNPEMSKLVVAFMNVAGTYLLTENKTLASVPREELEKLFNQLLQEPPVKPGPESGS